jgi:hypothetical protein
VGHDHRLSLTPSPGRLALWDALTSAKDIVDCWREVKFERLERRMEFLHRGLGVEPATLHARSDTARD